MLQLNQVSRQFPGTDRPAVNGVSLSVEQGECMALVGESGSGKTTLLRLVAGLERLDGGDIDIAGECVAEPAKSIWVRPEQRQVGLVFQDGALFPHMTGEQNVGYGLRAEHGDRPQRDDRVRAMLELTGLAELGGRYPHQLSGGERQRLALARALAPQPRLILLDEPFSSLDPSRRRKLRDEVATILRQVGTTTLLVTHHPEDALAVGDRVAVIREGELQQVGTPSDVKDQPKDEYCAALFGG